MPLQQGCCVSTNGVWFSRIYVAQRSMTALGCKEAGKYAEGIEVLNCHCLVMQIQLLGVNHPT